jgi:hypothetical protein
MILRLTSVPYSRVKIKPGFSTQHPRNFRRITPGYDSLNGDSGVWMDGGRGISFWTKSISYRR